MQSNGHAARPAGEHTEHLTPVEPSDAAFSVKVMSRLLLKQSQLLVA